MAIYRVYATGTVSAAIMVETNATDPHEIYEAAFRDGYPELCGSCAGYGGDSLELGEAWEPEMTSDGKLYITKESLEWQ